MFNFHDDIIDVRDLIEEIESIENELFDEDSGPLDTDTFNSYNALLTVMEELQGNGGDEEWKGQWYPITLIREAYFTEYAMDLLSDIGDLPRDIPHYIVIDRDATAENLLVDYTSIEIDDITYYYR